MKRRTLMKTARNRTRRTHGRTNRSWRKSHARRFLVVAFAVLSLGLVTIFSTHAFASSASPSTLPKPQGGYWNMPDSAFSGPRSAHTDSRKFFLGDSVIMPNGLEIQVVQVQYNWQLPAAMQASITHPDGDNPAGRQVVAIWFKVTDVGSAPIDEYNPLDFTLTIAGKPEQRVAHLAGLLSSAYGNMGRLPWLYPGQSMTTFEPFLVAPGAKPVSFQYYIIHVVPKSNQLPDLTRLSIALQPSPASGPRTFTFAPTQTMTVR
jgi:heme/copper-type cytochrome/quinol oxidase subunit 2